MRSAARASAFVFSSRRRHTRWPRDWSSDVCSSDLVLLSARATRTSDKASTIWMLRGGGETGDTREIQNLVGLCPVWVRLPPAALMRPRVEKEAALFLAGGGVNPCQISRLTHIPRTTIRDWLKPRYQHRPRRIRVALDLKSIPRAEYSYL